MITQAESVKRLNAARRLVKKSGRPAKADAIAIRWAAWAMKTGCR